MDSGAAVGVITDDWETLRLNGLESELVGGACGAAELLMFCVYLF